MEAKPGGEEHDVGKGLAGFAVPAAEDDAPLLVAPLVDRGDNSASPPHRGAQLSGPDQAHHRLWQLGLRRRLAHPGPLDVPRSCIDPDDAAGVLANHTLPGLGRNAADPQTHEAPGHECVVVVEPGTCGERDAETLVDRRRHSFGQLRLRLEHGRPVPGF